MNTSFADLGVPAPIVASLADRGITAPFPIQALTLADTLAGRDVSGKAPTGSGKTLAFGIPLVVNCDRAERRRPRGLVLVPTRELATQVAGELSQLAGRNGPSVEAFFGGVPIPRNARALDRGVDIAVACPGRLADLINQRLIRLDDVDFVVLDEADRMADMGFLPQVRKLLDQCNSTRQTVLFSATLDGDIDVLVRNYQHDPVLHELEVPEEELPDIDHHFWDIDRTQRVSTAAQIIDRMGPTVVFCRTKRGADRVAKQLGSAGVSASAIHGDRSQSQRDRALDDFRAGRAQALVATDVAARGIHVDDVAAVIHFDPPEDPKDYVHRSGRTARAGARGVVVSLVITEKASLVKGLQKSLDLPRGLTDVDLEALGEPTVMPVRKAAPANRRSRNEARDQTRNDRHDAKSRNGAGRDNRGNSRNGARTPSDERSTARKDRNRNRNGSAREGGGTGASRGTERNSDRKNRGRNDSTREGGGTGASRGTERSSNRTERSSNRTERSSWPSKRAGSNDRTERSSASGDRPNRDTNNASRGERSGNSTRGSASRTGSGRGSDDRRRRASNGERDRTGSADSPRQRRHRRNHEQNPRGSRSASQPNDQQD